MKQQVIEIIKTTITQLQEKQLLPDELSYDVKLENCRHPRFGDYACNLAMPLSKTNGLQTNRDSQHHC